MKLNRTEKWLVNNPARSLVQRFYEAPLLRRLGGTLNHAHVLEIGCGRGKGAKILVNELGAQSVTGVDLDPLQPQRAQRGPGKSRQVLLAAATIDQLPFPNECFDAVVDFGVLHHVVRWQAAVAEIRRVLKPAGRFFFEEVTRTALESWRYRTFLDHPKENRFTEHEFVAELATCGIRMLDAPVSIWGGDIFIGVAEAASC